MSVRYQDIFVPGGFPKLTYNPRLDLQLEERLRESQDNLCKLVAVTGQTKSGKTVLAKKIFPPEASVWVDGGTIGAEDDFWKVILEQLELFDTVEEETSTESGAKIGGKGTAGADFLLAKGSAEIGGELEQKKATSTTRTRTSSPQVVATRSLRSSKTPVVIDDFHYISKDIQGSLIRSLKPLIFEGVPIVIIAIPHRRYDAVKVEKEMTGRISLIEIPSWTLDELTYIAVTGFSLLNLAFDNNAVYRMASESIGSPHLMQDFCRGICKRLNLSYSQTRLAIKIADGDLDAVFRDVSETIGRPIFEKLARGPRARTDRLPRELKDGRTVDIYELILRGLAHLKPDLVSLEYEELRGAIKEVSASQAPQLHEVARVLKHMATIAATDESSTPVIDFEEEEKLLHITDPFFAFYLRWGQLATSAEA